MILTYENETYVLRGVAEDQTALMAEMRWSFAGAGEFHTRSPYLAAPFYSMFDSRDVAGQRALYPFAWNYATSFAKEAIPGLPGVVMRAGSDAPFPFQVAGIQRGVRQQSIIIGDTMGLGKAQPLDAKLRTPSGWARMADAYVGMPIAGRDGGTYRVTGVFPQGIKPIYRVTFSDGASTECCEEHLWRVQTKSRNGDVAPRVVALRDILRGYKWAAGARVYDVAPGWLYPNGSRRYEIPMCEPVSAPDAPLPISPYVMGALLGDGCLGFRVVGFSSADTDVIGRIRRELPPGLDMRKCKGVNYDYRITGGSSGRRLPNVLRFALDALGLRSHGDHKFIPEAYLNGSVAQRVALLQGLMDTDGYVAKDGTLQFAVNSERLTDGVAELVMSLGGCARKWSKPTASGKVSYGVTIAVPDSVVPVYTFRKFVRHKPRAKYAPKRFISGISFVGYKPAQCISVSAPDKLYLTDDYIVTHNTLQAIGVANARAPRRWLVACPAHLLYNWADEIARRASFPSAIHILDKARKVIPDYGVCIMPYSRGMSYWRALISGGAWDLVTLDEFHDTKNYEAQRSRPIWGWKDAPGVIAYSRANVALSGTPQLNHAGELYNVVAGFAPWLMQGLSREGFQEIYCTTRKFGAKVQRKKGPDARVQVTKIEEGKHDAALNAELRASGLLVRREKAEVLTQLPPKRLYLAFLPPDGKVEELVREETSLYEMLQLGDVTAKELIAIKGHVARVRRQLGLLKIPGASQYILDHFRNGETHVMAFGLHTAVLDGIAENVRRFGVTTHILDGRASPKRRHEMMTEFQNSGKRQLALLQIVAAGVGYTLTRACHGIGVESSWVPGRNAQVEDRLHRIGQTRDVEITILAYQHSVEARVLRAGARKEKSAARVLDTKIHEMLEAMESEG